MQDTVHGPQGTGENSDGVEQTDEVKEGNRIGETVHRREMGQVSTEKE